MKAAAYSRPPAVPQVWQAILVAGLAVLGLHYLGHVAEGGSRLYETWFYEGLELLAALGCLARAAFVRAERSAWFFIGAALLATTSGDILYDFWYGGNPPFPSVADVAYLAFYPLLYVGIVLLLRRRVSTFSATLWLDGLVAATAAAALGASVLVEVVVNSTHGSRLVVLTNIAYPIGDVLLLALVVFVFSVARWRPGRAWALIAAGLLLNVVGDAVYLYQVAVGTYVEGTYIDLAWPLSVVLIALAAWQRPGRVPRVELQDRAMLGTPIVCGLIATGVLVAASQVHMHPIALLLATITIVLVLARTALSFRERPAARGQPARGAHGLPHRARQPAQAPRRSRRGARGGARQRAAHARALRPQRLQDVQRHLRPSRRGRSAGPPCDQARGDGRACRCCVPHGRRRVLRAAAGARARHPRDRPGPVGERRGLRRHERVRRGTDSGRCDDRLDGAECRRRAAVRPQGATRRDPPRDRARAASAHPRRAGAGAPRPRGRRLVARRARGTAARSRARRARGATAGGRVARRRQARDSGRRPAEVGCARSDRVGLHPLPHADRTADPRRRPGAAAGRRNRPLDPRELGRHRLSRRPCG